MTGHALALIEDLYRVARAADVNLLAHQLIRRAVVVLVHLNVVIKIDARPLPLRIFESRSRQRLQSRSVDQVIEFGSRSSHLAKRPLIELDDQFKDGFVQLCQAEELSLTQGRQHPPLHDLNPDLGLRFVSWAVRPRRKDAHAVMNRQIAIRTVQLRFVPAGRLHARLQVVRHDQKAGAVEEFEGPHVRVRPVPQILRPGGLGIGVIAGSQHRHEHLRLTNFARLRVRHRNCLTGVVYERLLAGAMLLPQHHVQLPPPLAVKLAVPAVGVALCIRLLVLFPQKLEGDILPAFQFLVNRREVRKAATLRRSHRQWRIHAPLQRCIIHVGRQRPTQPRRS